MAKSFRTYMAESGQQSTVDDLERSGGFGAAEQQYNQTGSYGSGGGGGSGLPSVEDYINAIKDMLPEPQAPYAEVNPFFFDEEWANEYATAEFSPYFDELITDYLGDVDIAKERLGDDTGKFLTELDAQRDTFMEKSGIELERMIRGIKQGYESRGLFFSGMKNRDIRESQEDSQFGVEDYARQHAYRTEEAQTGEKRQLSDLDLGSGRFQRDTTRDKESAIAGGVGTLRGEAMDEYLIGAQAYYQNPNWGSMI